MINIIFLENSIKRIDTAIQNSAGGIDKKRVTPSVIAYDYNRMTLDVFPPLSSAPKKSRFEREGEGGHVCNIYI